MPLIAVLLIILELLDLLHNRTVAFYVIDFIMSGVYFIARETNFSAPKNLHLVSKISALKTAI